MVLSVLFATDVQLLCCIISEAVKRSGPEKTMAMQFLRSDQARLRSGDPLGGAPCFQGARRCQQARVEKTGIFKLRGLPPDSV